MIQYDIVATKSAMLGLSTTVADVRPYIRTMEHLTLGPQWIGEGIEWDPLGQLPAVEAALNTVKNHCFIAQIYFIDQLSGFTLELNQAIGGGNNPGPIMQDFAAVMGVVNELGASGANPSAQQRQIVDTALQDVQTRLANLTATLNAASAGAGTFLGQLSADAQTLTDGAGAIGPAIAAMQQNYENAVIQYSGIGGSGIVKTLEQIVGQQVQALQNVQQTVQAATAAEQPVASALSQFQAIFVTLNSRYVDAIKAVQEASGDSFASGLLAFDVPTAQNYWQQASDYAQGCGL